MYFYSAKMNAFYPAAMRADYEASGSWPEDPVEVSEECFAEFALAVAPEGKQREAGPDGMPRWVQVPAPTREEQIALLSAAVERHLNVVARSYEFKGIDDAISYADEAAVPKFQEQGRAFRAWRSVVRGRWFDVRDGGAELPTVAGLLAELPPFDLANTAT